jgi:hypothetical protein
MASLIDLFNPSFFMFLGILVLAVALLVVYFESKMREQNHKISSMLSLVSTLAEDLNGVKMGLNHLIMRGGNDFSQTPNIYKENLGNISNKELIEVSDDEEDDDIHDDESSGLDLIENNEDDESEDDESEGDESEGDESEDNESEHHEKDNIKILKLNISDEEKINENNDFDLEETIDLDSDFEQIDELPEIDNDYVEEVLDLKYTSAEENSEQDDKKEELNISASDFKTISIDLSEEKNTNEETIDYKKLQLPKLRNIVVEKGIATNSEVSKLKKPELLKMLVAE